MVNVRPKGYLSRACYPWLRYHRLCAFGLKLTFASALPDEAAVICGLMNVLCSTATNRALNG